MDYYTQENKNSEPKNNKKKNLLKWAIGIGLTLTAAIGVNYYTNNKPGLEGKVSGVEQTMNYKIMSPQEKTAYELSIFYPSTPKSKIDEIVKRLYSNNEDNKLYEVWVDRGGKLPVPVILKIGLTDDNGQYSAATEFVLGELKEGENIITGPADSSQKSSSSQSNQGSMQGLQRILR